MATRQYIGIDEKARRVRKAYIGIDNVARRIKKAYIGVNGVARLCYSANGPERVALLDFPGNRRYLASASVGSGNDAYAVFAGGGLYDNDTLSSCFSTVYAYDRDLTRQQLSNLSVGCMQMASASDASHAFFLGGRYNGGYTDRAYAYDTSLTLTNMASLKQNGGYGNTRAAMAGDKLITVGGSNKYIEYYDSTLTKKYGSTTANNMGWCVATRLGPSMASFAGGTENTTAIAINNDVSITVMEAPSGTNASGSAATHCDCAVFFWGRGAYIDVYDYDTLVKRTIGTCSIEYTASISIGDYLFLAGGTRKDEAANTTYYYSTITVRDSLFILLPTTGYLLNSKRHIAACAIGDAALFACGQGYTKDEEGNTPWVDYNTLEVFKYVS